jgi:hypothetical protein
MLIIPKFKKGGEYLSIGKHMHAKGQEIPITPFEAQGFPKVPPKRVPSFQKEYKILAF